MSVETNKELIKEQLTSIKERVYLLEVLVGLGHDNTECSSKTFASINAISNFANLQYTCDAISRISKCTNVVNPMFINPLNYDILKSSNESFHNDKGEIDAYDDDFEFYQLKKFITKKVGEKADDETWKGYLVKILKLTDRKIKTRQIAEIIIDSNETLSFIRARQIAADLLPELAKEHRILETKGNSKKLGNYYYLPKFLDFDGALAG